MLGLIEIHHISEETLRTIATVVGAAATSLAVVLALYRDTIREWRKRPKLSLEFRWKRADPIGPIVVDVESHLPPGGTVPSYWLRLLVTNGRKRQTATDVSVLITAADRIEGSSKTWAGLDTVALIWSNLPSPKTSVDLPPGVGRYVDFAALRWPKGARSVPRQGSEGCRVEIQVMPAPSAERNFWSAGTYRIELAVTAKDVPARRYSIELDFGGVWSPEGEQWSSFMLKNMEEIG